MSGERREVRALLSRAARGKQRGFRVAGSFHLLVFKFSLSGGEVASLAASAPSDTSALVGLLLLGGSLDCSGRGISSRALREQRRSALFRAASMDDFDGPFL